MLDPRHDCKQLLRTSRARRRSIKRTKRFVCTGFCFAPPIDFPLCSLTSNPPPPKLLLRDYASTTLPRRERWNMLV